MQAERQRRVLDFIMGMQMLSDMECPAPTPLPIPEGGIQNLTFDYHSEGAIPYPPPGGDMSPPPPPYSALDKPPEYSTLPRDPQPRPSIMGQAGTSQMGQGHSQANENSSNSNHGATHSGNQSNQSSRGRRDRNQSRAEPQGASFRQDWDQVVSNLQLTPTPDYQSVMADQDSIVIEGPGGIFTIDIEDNMSDISSVSSPNRRHPQSIPHNVHNVMRHT